MSCQRFVDGKCADAIAVAEHQTDAPTPFMCRACWRYDGPARGLGDIIHTVAVATGAAAVVERVAGGDCGCQKRREALNQVFPKAP